jgi:hypothetical protein
MLVREADGLRSNFFLLLGQFIRSAFGLCCQSGSRCSRTFCGGMSDFTGAVNTTVNAIASGTRAIGYRPVGQSAVSGRVVRNIHGLSPLGLHFFAIFEHVTANIFHVFGKRYKAILIKAGYRDEQLLFDE